MTEPEPQAEDPELLFAEYLQRIEDESGARGALRAAGAQDLQNAPDVPVELLLARAGSRRDELAGLLELHGAMEAVRAGTTGAALPDDSGDGVPPAPAALNGSLGRFERLQLIGEGGLSRVYLAYDGHLHRHVALKVLSAPAVDGDGARNWVLNEGRSIARLEHPGIVRIFDVDESDGTAFIAMEHVRGPSLREVLRCLRELAGRPEKDAPPISPEAREAAAQLGSVASRCELVAALAEALAYCHGNGVIHRDIKPANVLLAGGRQPKLIDFGLAHLEAAGGLATEITQRLVGTPAYIAPEQVDNNRTGASERSDQFALGVLLVELISLRNPFARDSRTETMEAISRAEPPRPRELDATISEDLERICVHALERDSARRYPSVAALAQDLRAFLEHRAISVRAPTPAMLAGLWARRHRRALSLLGAAACVLLLAGAGLRAADLRSSRATLQQRADSIAASLPQHGAPGDFSAIYLELDSLRRRAEELDASAFTGLLFEPIVPRVADTALTCSRRVGELFDARIAALAPIDTESERENRTIEIVQQWSSVLRQDSLVCPGSPYTRDAARRGTVELPGPAPGRTVRLWRRETLPRIPVATLLEEVADTADLSPGQYRLIVSEPAGEREMDFALRYEAPRWSADPAWMPQALFEGLLRCPGGTVRLDAGVAAAFPTHDAVVEPFAISPRLVTWREVAAAWGDTETDLLRRSYEFTLSRPQNAAFAQASGLDDPAVLNWRLAHAFATAVGARLPTVIEWRVAAGVPGFVLPPDPKLTRSPAVAVGEWTSVISYDQTDMRYRMDYSKQGDPCWPGWTSQVLEFGSSAGIGFRLARSLPSSRRPPVR
jgi:tRNA A-37 threonylcarbamoyl transferase component Bud32